MSGTGVSNKIVHAALVGLGAALLLHALRRTARPLTAIGVGAFAVLAVAAVITPPMAMSAAAMPWQAVQVGGAVLYLLFGLLLGYVVWRAFPTPQPGAAATAIGGTAVATGCGCCMITGALTGLAVTSGASADIVLRIPTIYTTGLLIAAGGAYRLGGFRPVAWLVAGGLVTRFGPALLRLTGDWMWHGINLRFIPGYFVYLAGAALVTYGIARAIETSRERERMPAAVGSPALAPAP